MPDPIHNPRCFASHMGAWMIEPGYARQALAAIRSGLWQPGAFKTAASPMAKAKTVIDPESDPNWPEVLYVVDDNGVALIQIQGVMAKAKGKYASTSSVQIRRALRACAADADVDAIMLAIDSPGGTSSGTQSLADDVRAIDGIKPVHAHIDDMGASANYWVPSQARRITANRSALIGSLGTYAVIEDSSKQAEMDGVVVHVIATGAHKGSFVDGAPVTPEQLVELQRTVDSLNAIFMEAVASGRGFTAEQTAALFDGRVHIAADAKQLKLVDDIMGLDQAMDELAQLVASKRTGPENARRLQLAKARR
jgi:signal peptide peptidase SppA